MRKAVALTLFLALAVSGLVYGQALTSSIVGHVTDPSGMPVAGANITATNTQTGATFRAETNPSGSYTVPELLAGVYNVTIAKEGFDTGVISEIQVMSAVTVRVDVQLKIGSVRQQVTVVSHPSMVQTDATNLSGTVTTRQLAELPTQLQTIDAFMALAPGVQAMPGADNNKPPMGGSTNWGAVHFTLNGVGADQPGNSGGIDVSGLGMLVLPPPSSLQELNIQTNNMTAKYTGKANVNIVMKNGTNQFHGSAYEYVQNTILNANEFLLNAAGEDRAAQHLNQYGGNIGGPIKRDKLFFFFDYGAYRSKDAVTVQHYYPSMAMRQGDFSAFCTAPAVQGGGAGTFGANGICTNQKYQLYNPYTGAAFANNQIPSNLIPSQVAAFLKYLPAPTDASIPGLPNSKVNNYVGLIPREQNMYSYDLRVDYNISSKDRLYGVYAQRNSDPWNTSNGYTADFGNGRAVHSDYRLSASEIHTFSPNTLNSFRVGWGKYVNVASGQNPDFNLQSIFPTSPGNTVYNGLPVTTMTGYGSRVFSDVGTAGPIPQYTVEFTDDFTHIHGKHTIEAGIDEMGYKIVSRSPSGTSIPQTGLFNFTGAWTGNNGWPTSYPSNNGNSFADFLLGLPNNDAPPVIGVFGKMVYARQWGMYVQDTWQTTPNLTITFGLRYEYQSPWLYRNPNERTTFSPAANAMEIPQNSDTATLPEGAIPDLFNAYKYVTTQSQGEPMQYVQPDTNNFAPRFGFAWRPFGGTRTVFRGGYGVYYNMQPAFVGSRNDAYNPPWNFGVSLPFTTTRPARSKITTSFQPDLTFTDPFPSASATGIAVPANPTVIFFQHNFENAMIEEWNATLEHQFANNWMARASYVGDHTMHLPTNAAAFNTPVGQTPNVTIQNQRPYQPWGAINLFQSAAYQNFNQLQLGIQRRFSNGFSFDGRYQFSRSLDNAPVSGGPQNWHFPNLDYGNSNLIRKHFMVFNYVYELPFGRGRHWRGSAKGVEDAILGGWQVSGITTYASGTPVLVTFTVPNSVTGWWGGRPDVVDVNQFYVGQQSGHDIVSGVQWFNPDAFAPPAKWTYGNAQRNMIWGPGYWNWDISGMKSFQIREGLKLTFRGDFLDAFNHMNLGQPNGTIADTRDGGAANPNSGVIKGGSGNRTVQLSLILKF